MDQTRIEIEMYVYVTAGGLDQWFLSRRAFTPGGTSAVTRWNLERL